MTRSKGKQKHENHDISSAEALLLLHNSPTDQSNSKAKFANTEVAFTTHSQVQQPHEPHVLPTGQSSTTGDEHTHKRKREPDGTLPPAKREPLSPRSMSQVAALRDLGATWRRRSCHQCHAPLLAGLDLRSMASSPCFSNASAKKHIEPTALCSRECLSCSAWTCFACGKAMTATKNKSRRAAASKTALPVCGCEESRLASLGIILSVLDAKEAFVTSEMPEEEPVVRIHQTRSRAKAWDKRSEQCIDDSSSYNLKAVMSYDSGENSSSSKMPESFKPSVSASDSNGTKHSAPLSSFVFPQASVDDTLEVANKLKKKLAEHGKLLGASKVDLLKSFPENTAEDLKSFEKAMKKSAKCLSKPTTDQEGPGLFHPLSQAHANPSPFSAHNKGFHIEDVVTGTSKSVSTNGKRSSGIGYGNDYSSGTQTAWDLYDDDIVSSPETGFAATELGAFKYNSSPYMPPSAYTRRVFAKQIKDQQKAEASLRKQRETAFWLLHELLPKRLHEEPDPSKSDWDPPNMFNQLVRESQVRSIMAEALSDDVLDADSDRNEMRLAIVDCVQRLTHHPRLRALITEERKSPSLDLFGALFGADSIENLYSVGSLYSSLSSMLVRLVPSCETTLRAAKTQPSAYKKSKRHLDFCNQVLSISGELERCSTILDSDSTSVCPWSHICKNGRLTFVDDDDVLKSHYFKEEILKLKTSGGPRFKRIFEDIAILKTSLPDGIFVKVAESRPDVMRFMVVGPEQTPYTGGLFEFHLFCPPKYPREAPRIWFPSAAIDALRLNPNLHVYGMVCLSLLGTWSGMGSEIWQPGKSTILQVLVSMQSMIFCAEPFYNEPGFGHREDKETSDRYSWGVQALTIRLGMLHWLEADTKKQSLWKDFLRAYFQSNADLLVATTTEWAASNRLVTKYNGFRDPMQISGFQGNHFFLSELDTGTSPGLVETQKRERPKLEVSGQNLLHQLEKAVAEFKKSAEAEQMDRGP